MEMREAPSLLSLTIKTAALSITHGCDYLQDVLELPFDLLEDLVMNLSPLGLQTLNEILKDRYYDVVRSSDNLNQRKRGRYEIFDIAWKQLYEKRWPKDLNKMEQLNCIKQDWHLLYCEAHLNECFDEATETALLPSFFGNIGEIIISDKIMNAIGYNANMNNNEYTKFSYHCKRFGPFSKGLRVQNVLCCEEMAELMRDCKFETLIFIRIISQNQVDGVCMLLKRQKETLINLEFIQCQFRIGVLNRIYDNICDENYSHLIRILKFKSSRFYETKSRGLLSFLASGRDLKCVHFYDTKLQQNNAQVIFDTLLQSSCNLSTLEISDNHISAWLSNLRRKYNDFLLLPEPAISLNNISTLNLRGNSLEASDALDISHLLKIMPNLINLDLSDNTLTDDGIRYLSPFFIWALQKEKPILNLNLANCFLTSKGINELIIKIINEFKEPLNMLSLADNQLGSDVAENIAKLMGEYKVKELNIEEICLETSGFMILEKYMPKFVSISSINISKNRGKNLAAKFISNLLLRAPNLVSINAQYNFMPSESLNDIYNSLNKLSSKNLARVDLNHNPNLCESEFKSEILKFEFRGHPIVILPTPDLEGQDHLYDDDP